MNDLFSSLAIASNLADFTPAEITEEAIERVGEHANKAWKREVMEVITDLCTKKSHFSADDVQERLTEKTHNNSALGSMLKKAEKLGFCRPDGVVRSKRKGRHQGLLVLWRSCLS